MRSNISLIFICSIGASIVVCSDDQAACNKVAMTIESLQGNSLDSDKLYKLLEFIKDSPTCDSIKDLDIYKSLYTIHQSGSGEPNCDPFEFARITKVIQAVKSYLGHKNLINYAKDQKLNLFIACDSYIDRDLEREVKQLYRKYFWNRKIGANIRKLANRIYPLANLNELDVTSQDFVEGFVAYYEDKSANSKPTFLEADIHSILKDLNQECQRIKNQLIISSQRLLQFDNRAQMREMDDFVGGWILSLKVCEYIGENLKKLDNLVIIQIVNMFKKDNQAELKKQRAKKKRFSLFKSKGT